MKPAVILCPLSIEQRAVAKAMRGRADVRLSGPGASNVRAAVEVLAPSRPPLVVLFGLAGGLRELDRAPRIGRVLDKDGRAWAAPSVPPGESDPATIVGMDEPVLHRARKRQMGTAYGASMVDMESHAFAEACTQTGLRWAVVKGICDGPDVDLPAGVTEWVNEAGKTRLWGVLLAAILNPGVVPAAIALARRARPALKAASARLIELINTEAAMSGAALHAPPQVVLETAPPSFNPIERQLGRRSARLNDPKPTSRER
jgi:hypothetical protein